MEERTAEYQVVIIVDYDDGRMFPLTEEIPKCLLPVCNKPVLSFHLDTLEKSGAEGIREKTILLLFNMICRCFYCCAG